MQHLEKRLHCFLKSHKDRLPWPYGCSEEKLSDRARGVWQTLTPVERLGISKRCPFVVDRNRMLYRLYKETGIAQCVLEEISGLHDTTITRGFKRIEKEESTIRRRLESLLQNRSESVSHP